MPELSYLKVFLDWTEATEKLNDADKGRLIDAMVRYARGEENADSRLKGNEAYLFPMFRLQIDRDKQEISKKRQVNSENGKHGGAPMGNQNARKNNPEQPKTTENNQNKPDKDKDYRLLTTDDNIPPTPPAGGTDAPSAEKPKRKRNPPTPPELTPDEKSALLAFSPGLCDAVRDWLCYKAERRFQYKPTGRRTLIGQICDNARQYGADAVTAIIRQSITSGYVGIVFDKLSKPQYGGGNAGQPPRKSWSELAAEIERERSGQDGFA